ncbi:hypothetical protein CMO91_04615 [Candidatus Woesearchaeota archaeon]|nr:hypothetical protein [Candidatus Woesearchaeota archaeon]
MLWGLLGFPAGMLVAQYAKDEMVMGRGWLFLLKGLLFGILVFVGLFSYLGFYGLLLIPLSMLLAGWLNKGVDVLLIFGLMFLRSDLLLASLLFLYGLPAGTLWD